jgi:hypothetical protein
MADESHGWRRLLAGGDFSSSIESKSISFPSNKTMKVSQVLLAALVLVTAGLTLNQWRLQRALAEAAGSAASRVGEPADTAEQVQARLRDAERRFDEAKVQLDIAERKLASANAQISQLDQRLRQLEAGGPRRSRIFPGTTGLSEEPAEPTTLTYPVKRAWGPEQVTGEPDTLQAGDISTAWASLEQDGGEEWLKLDYENAVDIAEVRVRETHNPGAVSKVTAITPGSGEATLWEGVEPKSAPPVEMSFTVPNGVNAKSIKVYLDTKRVPGWNEIDAVELIGRDGSHQWAKQASASSTYAEPSATRERLINR